MLTLAIFSWVLCAAYPEIDLNGSVKSIFGVVTNITDQKNAEDFQKRRMEEAVEMKRQQENFIDITSHEMRNPLSAILLSAEEISATLLELQTDEDLCKRQDITEKLEACIDATQTLLLCGNHQKRIINGMLGRQ